MRRPIEPSEQRDPIPSTSWEWRGERAATRDDEWETQIECRTGERGDWDQRKPA